MKTCIKCRTTETCRWYSGPTCNTCRGKAYREANPDYHRQYQQKQYATNAEVRAKNAERQKKLYETQYEKIIEKRRIYQQQRLKTDLLYKLKRNLRSRLNKAGSAVNDLGCSIEEFKVYLESKFQPGMTWNNYGDWHIDHIKPLASFDVTDPEQVKQVCHYTNLQPLWKEDNLRKGDK